MATGSPAPEMHPQPLRGRGALEIAGEIGKLFKFGRQHRALNDVLLAHVGRAAGAAPGRKALAVAPPRRLAPDHLALADEPRGELRSAAVLAAGAAQDQSVATIFHQRLRLTIAVGRRHLRNRLKTEHAATAEFS